MHNKYHFDNDFTVNPKKFENLLIYQLGEMLCDSTTVVDPHVHLDWFEFTYVFNGTGIIYTDNVPLKVSKGNVYVSFPNEVHKIVSDNIDPLRYCFFAFNFSNKDWAKEIIEALMQFKDPASRGISAPHYESYFLNALKYINSVSSPLMDKLLEHELLTLVIRVAHRAFPQIADYNSPKIKNYKMLTFSITNYIDTNLTTIENITSLSEVFSYNYSYLSRCFKKCMSISISEYFNDKKLNMAKTFLELNTLSITEIASKLNYSTIYVFSRAFKNKYHVSPKEYRASVIKNANKTT